MRIERTTFLRCCSQTLRSRGEQPCLLCPNVQGAADASVARFATPSCPSRRIRAFAGAACAKKHRATTSRPSPVFPAPTSFGPEGNPALSTRRQPLHATSAASAVHRSRTGALRSIASPSPWAVSTSLTIFRQRCNTASRTDHILLTVLRKARVSRALSRHRGPVEITPLANTPITTHTNGRRPVSATHLAILCRDSVRTYCGYLRHRPWRAQGLGPSAQTVPDVAFWHLADIPARSADVCFRG